MPEVTRVRLDVPFEGDESQEYEDFLKATGRKSGPWVRTLIIKAMAEEKARTGTQQ